MAKSPFNKSTKKEDAKNPNHHTPKQLDNLAHNPHGNLDRARETIKYMRKQEQNNNGWIEPEIFPHLKEQTKLELYHYELEYWTEFFIFMDKKTGKPHPQLEFAKPFIIEAFYNGVGVGIMLDKNEQALVYTLTRYFLNPYRQVTNAWGILYAYPQDYRQESNFNLQSKELFNDTTALVLSNPWGRSWRWGLEIYSERRWQSLNARDVNVVNSTNVKAILTSNASENAIKEIKQIHSTNRPLVTIAGDLDTVIDLGLDNQQEDVWEDYESLWKAYSRMRGIRFNLDAKGDRNVAGEIGNNDATFIIKEGRKKRILDELVFKINNLFNTEIEVVSILELQAYKENQIEANLEEEIAKVTSKYENKNENKNNLNDNKLNDNKNVKEKE